MDILAVECYEGFVVKKVILYTQFYCTWNCLERKRWNMFYNIKKVVLFVNFVTSVLLDLGFIKILTFQSNFPSTIYCAKAILKCSIKSYSSLLMDAMYTNNQNVKEILKVFIKFASV